ncbi:hypothetical protein EDB51_101359 [Vibrio crassostreae]|nr:hypothetical protein EDB37_102057 [Vibrio crassostreae]TCO05351.1 hypothetical protein EDB51_101359 [Vibrio crassostreae]
MGLSAIDDPVQINPPHNGDVDHDEYSFCDSSLQSDRMTITKLSHNTWGVVARMMSCTRFSQIIAFENWLVLIECALRINIKRILT